MGSVETVGAVPIWEAAELLGLTIAEVYDLVFARTLPSVEAPNGRRLVLRSDIEIRKSGQASLSA